MAKVAVELVWFKRDLRISDHLPLFSASKHGIVLPIYIFEPDLWMEPDLSFRHYDYLLKALNDLDAQLKEVGSKLHILVGNACEVLSAISDRYRIERIWCHQESWNSWTYKRDKEVRAWVTSNGIRWIEEQNNGTIRNLKGRDGWARKWYRAMACPAVPTPRNLTTLAVDNDPMPHPLSLKLSMDQPVSKQTPTRSAGLATLNSFLNKRCANYQYEMSSPLTAENSCSRISPYLAFGQISIREAYHMTEKRSCQLRGVDTKYSKSLKSFSSRLRWHCHFKQKLEDQPNIETNTLHTSFENLRPNVCDPNHIYVWENGITGYPMVDACMRYLNETGWLNFRMRAMLVSFASYHLWLDWRLTAMHLARQFLDYEPGIHYSQIQMQSGTTGMNSIRIYNPIKQGIDQDPDGEFIRKWVPELKDIPSQFIHQPWLSEVRNLDYPRPIVDEKLARTTAQEKIYSLKKQIKKSVETASLVQKHASRLKRRPRKKLKPSTPVKKQLSLDL